jgi:integrase
MASLSKDKRGNRTIQFVAADRKRRSIRLGRMPLKDVLTVQLKVEALNAAAVAQASWDSETTAWVARVTANSPKLHDKLSNVGLVPKRAAALDATLWTFLAAYIAGRTDLKRSTKFKLSHVQGNLVEKFGAEMPLANITPGDADEFRRWLATDKGLGDNTVRRRCGVARQFFRAAVRKRLIAENPFGEMKGVSVKSNRARDYFLTREDAAKVLDACPNAEWRAIFALARYGGLRCPSEIQALRWSDIDWAGNRFTVTSDKTAHHGDEHASRIVPLFAELRPYLEKQFDLAEDGTLYVVSKHRGTNANLRTQLERIIAKAGLKPWPKLFQNLRATHATELAAQFPAHVAADWLGHSTIVAQKHYWRTTEDDFARATEERSEAVQNAVQHPAASGGREVQDDPELVGACAVPDDFGANQCSLMDSNHEPTD